MPKIPRTYASKSNAEPISPRILDKIKRQTCQATGKSITPTFITKARLNLYQLIDLLNKVQAFPDKKSPNFRLAIITATKPLVQIKELATELGSDLSPVAQKIEDLFSQLILQATSFLRCVIPGSGAMQTGPSFGEVVAITKEIAKLLSPVVQS